LIQNTDRRNPYYRKRAIARRIELRVGIWLFLTMLPAVCWLAEVGKISYGNTCPNGVIYLEIDDVARATPDHNGGSGVS